MIRFSLRCDKAPDDHHNFEGWFGSTGEFETQQKRGLIACPTCGSTSVQKAIMAPKVKTGRAQDKQDQAQMADVRRKVFGELKKMRDHVTENCTNVGAAFPEEVRKMHYGEKKQTGIYGEASRDGVVELRDEGIEITPLPVLPEDVN